MSNYDVIVVGAGNAAQAAAMSALENGAKKVAILEKANEGMRGGNTHWSGGILRIAFDDSRELAPFLPGVEEKFLNFYDGIQPYTKKKYMEDLKVIKYPCSLKLHYYLNFYSIFFLTHQFEILFSYKD